MNSAKVFWILAIYLVIFIMVISWSIIRFVMDTEELQSIRKRARKRTLKEKENQKENQ